MAISDKTYKSLAFRSGDRCAMPDCLTSLTVDSENTNEVTNTGQAAHIKGKHSGNKKKQRSARYDPTMSNDERDHYSNLIYLCSTCHKKIDSLPQGEIDYPVEKLLVIKHNHEAAVKQAISDGFAKIGFSQLEQVTKWITTIPPQLDSIDFTRIDLDGKIEINKLSASSQNIIKQGLCSSTEVNKFIQDISQTEPDFSNKLSAGFKQEYYRLYLEDLQGDELFESMCYFAQKGFKTQAEKSAGLAVLIYLFELCEIFEKE